MARGPLGFPRVTDVGPFVESSAEQKYTREVRKIGFAGSDVDREIATAYGLDLRDVQVIDAKLQVEEKEGTGEFDGVLGTIEKEIESLRTDYDVSRLSYWMAPKRGVAKIIKAETEEEFRGMGVATRLKEMEMEKMEQSGVDVVFTDIVSQAGNALATKTGFKPIDEFTDMEARNMYVRYNHDSDIGVMFRKL